MDRLTFDGNFCDIAMCQEVPCKYPDTGCSQKQVWERLQDYERTGLMPDEVEAMKVAMMGKSVAEVKEFCGISIEQMVELAEAYRHGRCLCSQYPIGATVYRLNREFARETKFIDGERYFREVNKWVVVKCLYTWADAAADSENPGYRKFYLNKEDAIRDRDELNRKEAEAAIGGGQHV